ncbi:MAG: tetratricopeptide repeat protein [Candidatus Latescibacterota bacterium]|jgi:Flp pilus assembly protein TadD
MGAGSPVRVDPRTPWIGCGVAFLLACLLYLPSLGHGFHYDDLHSVVHNPHLRDWRNLPAFFSDPTRFSADPRQAMYRPLLLATYALNWAVDGSRPVGYHAVNVALHGLNASLVTLLVWRLLGGAAIAWGAGLLFAVHPVNAEAANYVSSRSELLVATLLLLACLAYRRYRREEDPRWYAVTLLAGAGALLCKSTAAALPLVLLVIDGLADGFRSLRQRWRAYAGAALLPLVYALATHSLVSKAMTQPVRPLSAQVWTQLKAGAYYLYLVAVPVRLSVEHQFSVADHPGHGSVIAAALLLASLAFLVGRGAGRVWPGAALWSLVTLLPATAVPLIVLVNEHRLYLPLVGYGLGLAWLLGGPGHARRPAVVGAAGAGLLVLGLLSFQRGQVWADELTLWQDAARKAPLMVKPHLRLADALAEAGCPSAAEVEYRRALALRPEHPGTRNNLGSLLLAQGRLAEAEAEFRTVLVSDPEVSPARMNLANLLLRRGEWAAAGAEYERLATAGETGGEAERQLAQIALQYRRDPEAALAAFDRALTLGQERHAGTWCGRGVALKLLGRATEAETSYRRALELDPRLAEVWYNLGNLLTESGRPADARLAYLRAADLEPGGGVGDLARRRLAESAVP